MSYSTTTNSFRFSVVLLGFITLVACGGVDEVALPSSTPIANAGADQTPLLGNIVTLDGSASSDVDGDGLTFSWSFTSVPTDSAAALSDPTAVRPTFVMDKFGDYVVQLIVNDDKTDSAPDTVAISTSNSAPVADAGADQTRLFGDTVILDGSASFDVDIDVDGNGLTYSWEFTSKPAGSTAPLFGSTEEAPIFIIDVSGDYVVQLIVKDTMGVESAPDTVTISTSNSAPVANAGENQEPQVGDTVILDGSASFDIDGDTLTYRWSFLLVPPGSTAVLSDPIAVSPTFVMDQSGDYVLQLIVYDGTVDSEPNTMVVTTN